MATLEADIDEALTVDDFGAIAKLSRSKIYEEIREKRLVARKIGNATRILRTDARAYLASLPVMGANRVA